MVEKSKDDAMVQLARNGSAETAPYWQMAEESDTCPNWIAKWFLYHKFRYRDGRNKSKHSSGHKAHKPSNHQGSSSSFNSQRHSSAYNKSSSDTSAQDTQPTDYDNQKESYYPVYPSFTAGKTFEAILFPVKRILTCPYTNLWAQKQPAAPCILRITAVLCTLVIEQQVCFTFTIIMCKLKLQQLWMTDRVQVHKLLRRPFHILNPTSLIRATTLINRERESLIR